MYLGQWDVSLDPIEQTVLTELYTQCRAAKFTIVRRRGGNNSSAGIAAVVVAIEHKHTFRFKEQSMLTFFQANLNM